MSCRPNKKLITMPLRTRMQFDFELGTKLKITLNDGSVYVGYVANRRSDKKSTYLKVDAAEVILNKENYIGNISFESEEIREVEILGDPEEYKRELGHQSTDSTDCEYVYKTVELRTAEGVQRMVSAMKGVNELALNMYGIFVGRDGKVGYITLFIEDTLVCIDLLAIIQEMPDFWEVFGEQVLENERILKVIYNSRPIADYLYHKYCILLKNVFDVQVAAFFNWCRGKSRDFLNSAPHRLNYMRLSECLKTFLPGKVIREEMQLLEQFEKRDFSANSPLMERPITETKICKSVAVDMKHLLCLKAALTDQILHKYNTCVEAQMNDIVMGNNDVMETSLKSPLCVPGSVHSNMVFTNKSKKSNAAPKLVNSEADKTDVAPAQQK